MSRSEKTARLGAFLSRAPFGCVPLKALGRWVVLLVAAGAGSGCSGGGERLPKSDVEPTDVPPLAKSGRCSEGAERRCAVTLNEHDGVLSCWEGSQSCLEGRWGPCHDGLVVARAAPDLSEQSLRLQALSDVPQVCRPDGEGGAGGEGGAPGHWVCSPAGGAAGSAAEDCVWVFGTGTQQFYNPCDPSCRYYTGAPPEPVTGTLFPPFSWQHSTVPLDTVLAEFPALDIPTLCRDAADCQFNQRCVEPVTDFTPGGACPHSKCVTGAALNSDACYGTNGDGLRDSCIDLICSAGIDPTCCTDEWDLDCVAQVKTTCDAFCPGIAAEWHSLCETGGPLPTGYHDCVDSICAVDPTCCDPAGSWGASCVQGVVDVCEASHFAVGCGSGAGGGSLGLCDYALYTEADLTLGQQGAMVGKFGAEGNAVITDTVLSGTLEVGGSLDINGADVTGTVIVQNKGAKANPVNIRNLGTFDGTLWANGSVWVDGTKPTGTLHAVNNLTGQNNGLWTGTVYLGGTVIAASTVKVKGDLWADVDPGSGGTTGLVYHGEAPVDQLTLPTVQDLTIPTLTVEGCGTIGTTVTVQQASGPVTLTPGHHGPYVVSSLATLILDGAGIYSFESLTFLANSNLQVDIAGGTSIRVCNAGSLVFNPNVVITFPDLPGQSTVDTLTDVGLLQWYYGGATAILLDQLKFPGVITAPNATVDVRSSTVFNGAAHAEKALFHPGVHNVPDGSGGGICAYDSCQVCDIDSTIQTLPETADCLPWTPNQTEATEVLAPASACAGYDLAAAVACLDEDQRIQVPVCNHGTEAAPAGVEVGFWEYPGGAGEFGHPDPSSSPSFTCAASEAVPAGSCVNVDCGDSTAAGIGARYVVMVNPSGAGTECTSRDNWAVYWKGDASTSMACGLPVCSVAQAHDVCELPLQNALEVSRDDTLVTYDAGSGEVTIPHAAADDCANNDDGWVFDDVTTPTAIVLCPGACSTVTGASGAVITAQVGCTMHYTQMDAPSEAYRGECEPGEGPQWGFLNWESTAPSDSYLTFRVRTARTEEDLANGNYSADVSLWDDLPEERRIAAQGAADPLGLGVDTTSCDMFGPARCPVVLSDLLPNHEYLELVATLYPSSDRLHVPALGDWAVTYSCVPSE